MGIGSCSCVEANSLVLGMPTVCLLCILVCEGDSYVSELANSLYLELDQFQGRRRTPISLVYLEQLMFEMMLAQVAQVL